MKAFALIYALSAFNLFAVTEPGSVMPNSVCEETLLPAPVRLLNRALSEGVVSRESVEAWLDGKRPTPVLVKSWNTDQLPVAQGIKTLLQTQTFNENRTAIESWYALLAGRAQTQSDSRQATAKILRPIEILEFETLSDSPPILETGSTGELRFASIDNWRARIYRWSAEELKQGKLVHKRPETHKLSAANGTLTSWSYRFDAKGDLKAFARDGETAVFVDFATEYPSVVHLKETIQRNGIRMLSEKWAATSAGNSRKIFSTDASQPPLVLYETPSFGHLWSTSKGTTVVVGGKDPGHIARFELKDGEWDYETLSYYARSHEVIRKSDGQVIIALVEEVRSADSRQSSYFLRLKGEDGQDLCPAIPVENLSFENPALWISADDRLFVALVTDKNYVEVYEPFVKPEPLFKSDDLKLPPDYVPPRLHWIPGLRNWPTLVAESGSSLTFFDVSSDLPFALASVPLPQKGHTILRSNDGRYFAIVEDQNVSIKVRLYSIFSEAKN